MGLRTHATGQQKKGSANIELSRPSAWRTAFSAPCSHGTASQAGMLQEGAADGHARAASLTA